MRSGEYKQNIGSMRSNDGSRFCCLGVLCDMGSEGRWVPLVSDKTVFAYDSGSGDLVRKNFPPPRVLAQSGLSNATARALALMNDKGASFEEIAKWIEERL